MTSSYPPNHTENNFDTLRLLLALVVVFSSCFLVGDGITDRDPFKEFVHGQLISSHLAMDCFFMMSGFLATASVERCRSAWEYVGHRMRRVYPGFALAMLFFAAMVPWSGGSFAHPGVMRHLVNVSWHTFALNEFPYRDVFAHNPFPEHMHEFLWPVSYGFGCYLLTLLLDRMKLLRRVGCIAAIWVVTAVLGAWINATLWFSSMGRWHAVVGYPHLWVRALPYYFGGTLVYLLRERIRWDWRLLLAALALLCAGAQFRPGWEAAFPLAGLYALFYIALHPTIRLPHLARWGDFSYGTFLWHFPILQMLVAHGVGLRSPYKLFAWGAPLSVLAGVLSWWGVERWFVPRARQREAGQLKAGWRRSGQLKAG